MKRLVDLCLKKASYITLILIFAVLGLTACESTTYDYYVDDCTSKNHAYSLEVSLSKDSDQTANAAKQRTQILAQYAKACKIIGASK